MLHSVYSFRRPNPEAEAGDDARRLRRSLILTATVAAVLWLSKLVEAAFGLDLVHYGVYPRKLDGLAGILWAPLIHGSFPHLIANTVPIVVLGTALLYGYPKAARIVCRSCIWARARGCSRRAYHIAPAALAFRCPGFTAGVLRRDRALSISPVFFGTAACRRVVSRRSGISSKGISWAVLVLPWRSCLRLIRRHQKKYSWELDASEADNQRPPQY